jgi:TonB-dependent starch-binding outer membrane protein SusC
MKKIYILVNVIAFIWMSGGGVVWAQQTWSGTITDENGLPLPGATVIVENTNRGVVSDFDGNFSIQANQGESILISYVGYQSQRLTLGSDNTTQIQLNS